MLLNLNIFSWLSWHVLDLAPHFLEVKNWLHSYAAHPQSGMMDEYILGVLDILNTLDRMEADVDALREELRGISMLLEEKKK